MQEVGKVLESLKGVNCQWWFKSGPISLKLDGKIKDVGESAISNALDFKIYSSKTFYFQLSRPLTYSKEENDEFLRYTVYSNGDPVVLFGYKK